jgi:hypothetical protein
MAFLEKLDCFLKLPDRGIKLARFLLEVVLLKLYE